ncbi:DsrH/TusB family sulfur metabolism protein [Zhongshania sp.]
MTLQHHDISICALCDDLDRRGIRPISAVTPIDYSGFVALCAQHHHCLSW